MKYIKILFLAAIIAFQSCAENETEKKLKEGYEKFSAYISQCDTSRVVYFDTTNTVTHLINDKIEDSRQASIVYLVDAECSQCIADFLSFSAVVNYTGENIEVYGIVNEDHYDITDYYLDSFQEGFSFEIRTNLIGVTEVYPYGNLKNHNNVFLLQNGRIVDNILYNSGDFIY